MMSVLLAIVFIGCAFGIIFALWLISYILGLDTGTDAMRDVNSRINEGGLGLYKEAVFNNRDHSYYHGDYNRLLNWRVKQ